MNAAISLPTLTLEAPRLTRSLPDAFASAWATLKSLPYLGSSDGQWATGINFVVDVERSSAEAKESLKEALGFDRKAKLVGLERKIISFLSSPGFDFDENGEQLFASVPEALTFLAQLPRDFTVPAASLSQEGSVTLEWDASGKRASATFDGEDDYGYSYFSDGRFVAGLLPVTIHDGFPADLQQYMTE